MWSSLAFAMRAMTVRLRRPSTEARVQDSSEPRVRRALARRWLFYSRHHPRESGNAATVAFRPPFVGRWRVTGDYDGTRTTSPSPGGTARFTVLEPLTG